VGEESSVGDVKRTTRQPVVEPERGRSTVVNIHISDRSVSIKFIANNFPQIGLRSISGGVKGCSISKNPVFPRSKIIREELVNKFHEQTPVLLFEILNTEASTVFTDTYVFPGHETFGTMTDIFPRPEESTTTAINSFDDSLRDIHSSHKVEGEGAENRSSQGEAPRPIKQRSPPTRKVSIT